jgi:hypothetical protein
LFVTIHIEPLVIALAGPAMVRWLNLDGLLNELIGDVFQR